jgi:hypothetical protein
MFNTLPQLGVDADFVPLLSERSPTSSCWGQFNLFASETEPDLGPCGPGPGIFGVPTMDKLQGVDGRSTLQWRCPVSLPENDG